MMEYCKCDTPQPLGSSDRKCSLGCGKKIAKKKLKDLNDKSKELIKQRKTNRS